MDLSKLSTEDLQALKAQNLSAVSDEGLQSLKGMTASSEPVAPVDDSKLGMLKRGGTTALEALGKVAGSLRNVTIGPATAAIIKAATGKDVVPDMGSQMAESLNPTNAKQFPSNSEMFKRAGIPNPSLSDALPSLYSEKGKGAHWWTPEKGGMLDPTAAGTLQTVTDPAMWLGAGEVGAGAKALNEASTASKVLGAVSTPIKVLGAPGKLVAKGAEALPVVGPHMNTLVNPLSALTRALGRSTYGATLRPVEHEGELIGKPDVVRTMRDAGVWQPFGMENKVQEAGDTLMNARGKIMSEAADKGATVNMGEALAPGLAEAKRLRGLGSPSADALAEDIESELIPTIQRSRGTPPTPGQPAQYGHVEVPSKILDEQGNPLTRTERVEVAPAIEGTPGVPAQPYTPQKASDLKSYMTETLPTGAYKPSLGTPIGARGIKKAASGLKGEIENSVENATGKGQDLREINQDLGAVIGTKKSQMRVSQKADRDLDNIVRGTGMDAVVGGGVAGATGSPYDAVKAILMKKAIRATQLGTMPSGYALQALGDTNVLDRLNELVQQKKQRGGK